MFTIYSADVTGNPGNCSYPHKHVILDEASLKEGICHDYVCAEYRNSYRNGDNFIGSDCLPVDCDNDHTEDSAGWKTPEDVMEAFPGVTFAIHYSRFNMREKNGKPARPKFHVLFPIDYITDAALYSDMKKLINSIFPYFDTKALDAARFFFGTNAADVAIYPGRMTLTEFLEEDAFDDDMPDGQYDGNTIIPEGSRNATMSRFAGRVIKKYGDSDEAYQAFMDEAVKCVPPLEASELSTIWHSAQRFFARIRQQDGYVPPEVYNDPASYKPEDYSDVGQAEVLSKYFSKELRYSPATHFIRYSDHYWQESEPGAQAVAHELTRRQMKEAGRDLLSALEKMKNSGAQTILDGTTKSKAEQLMSDEQLQAYQEFLAAQAYRAFVIKRRDSKNITSTLKESHPMLEISPRDLDADCFALNTPEATYDLRLGMRFRGQISQGLLLPVSQFPEIPKNADVGDDVTELLGVRKWEIEERATTGGTVIGTLPYDIPHTDETRVQEEPELIQAFVGLEYYISTKMDGSSHSIGIDENGFHVTGHNYEYKDDGSSSFYKLVKAREYQAKLEDYMKVLGLKTLTIQGELCAPGIQQNRLRLTKPEWYVFTIRENGKRVGLKRMLQICEALDITPVPIEEVGTDLPSKYPTVEALLSRADGEYPNGGKKEGIVIRPTEPVFCPLISASLSMKVVSNKYLLKNDG